MKTSTVKLLDAPKPTTLDFIKALFGKKHLKSKNRMLFCGFPDDPKNMRKWSPAIMRNGKLPSQVKCKDNNCYFSVSTYFPDEKTGKYRAKKEFVGAAHVIVLDDIGTKIKSDLPLKPSWKVKTSPGNYQVGYILDNPCTDIKLYESVVSALGESGWTDKGMLGAYRWARLPFGRNTKSEYCVNKKSPSVNLVFLKAKRRYSLDKIIEKFGINVNEVSTPAKSISSTGTHANNSEVLSAIKAAGIWKAALEAGKHEITCPWLAQHTGQVDHGTIYYEPSPDNNNKGGFTCRHDHCSTRNLSDLCNFLGLTQEKPGKKGQVDLALELVQDLQLFKDPNGIPYCYIDGNCLPLRSGDVRNYISHQVFKETGKALNRNALGEVLTTLEGKACFDSKEFALSLRIASHDTYFWYDLGDGKVVRTGPENWKIVDAPIIFQRFDHQKKQVTPITGGDAWKLLKFLNVPEKHHLETLVVVISYLIPDIAHPVIHPYGPKGSAKSTACRLIKRLIDPSSLELISSTKDIKEVMRQLTRHHMPIFDNVSRISSELSDIFCTACTGGGFSKRTLFTNDDDCIYTFKRSIAINGINLVIAKPDLLDRTMLLHLDMIRAEHRKEEVVVFDEFEAVKPKILGGMFDILSKAMKIYPKVNLKQLPRLADFARWGYAIAEAIEKGKGQQFMDDYQNNVKRQNAEVLQNNSLCLAVTHLMDTQDGYWHGTVKKAYDALSLISDHDKSDKTFPASSKNLRKHLELIQNTLIESEGIDFKFSEKRKKSGFFVTFTKSDSNQ